MKNLQAHVTEPVSTDKPRIDLKNLLNKVKLDHLARLHVRPDTYTEEHRQRNIGLIAKLEGQIEAVEAVRNGTAQAVIAEGERLGVI